ncbi:hypothetical protein [Demequina phytophila]|uniref:hypothetical protein n=1 Tax=Demequina phytophila TaxID=1638981 RepID=UPI0007850475|nr:hypothetical protein [Demequina phytophila]
MRTTRFRLAAAVVGTLTALFAFTAPASADGKPVPLQPLPSVENLYYASLTLAGGTYVNTQVSCFTAPAVVALRWDISVPVGGTVVVRFKARNYQVTHTATFDEASAWGATALLDTASVAAGHLWVSVTQPDGTIVEQHFTTPALDCA